MAIGFHTGVLQDRTLDIVRAHDKIMQDLLQHGFEKQEEREKAFLEVMSTDFVKGLEQKAQEKQMKAIQEFNELGTQVMKNNNLKFGNLSVESQMSIRKKKDELISLQENMLNTIKGFEEAKSILQRDGGRKWDYDDSVSMIKQEFAKWDGEKHLSFEQYLVPAYGNPYDNLNQRLGDLEWDTSTHKEKSVKDGNTYLEEYKWNYRRGMEKEENRINFLINFAGELSQVRDTDKLLEGNKLSTKARESFIPLKEFYLEKGVPEREAEVLAIIEASAGVPLLNLFEKKGEKTGEEPISVGSGGKTGDYQLSELVWEYGKDKNKGMQFTSKVKPRVEVEGRRIEGVGGNSAVTIEVVHVGYDGTVVGKYRGNIRMRESDIPSRRGGDKGYIPVLKSGRRMNREGAMKLYNEIGFSGRVVDVVINDESLPENKQKWIPIVSDDQGKTVYFKLDEDYKSDPVYTRLTKQVTNFAKPYESKRGVSKESIKTKTAAEFRNMSIPERKAFRESGGQVK